jgi:hypothetical protein
MEHAAVAAVYPCGGGSTIGTCCARSCGTEGQGNLISHRDLQELHALW